MLVFATTLSAAGLLGIAPSSELLSGLSSPAVVTVAAMLIIAAGVVHTGIVSRAGRRILGDASTLRSALTRLLYPIGFASSFMNNTPIIAMTIPAAQEFEQTSGIAARRLLMPVAFAAAMGGATTLVGTSSNLLIASLAGAEGIELGFFAFTPVALPTFFVGVGLLILIVRKVLRREEMTSDNTRRWRVELHVGAGALLQGNTLAEGGLLSARDYEATSVVRGTETVAQTNPLDAGDVITYEANANGVCQLWANPRFGQKNQRLYQVTLGTGASGNLGQLGHHDNLNILAALDSMGELSAATARPGEVLYVTSSSVQALESVEDIAMVTDVGDRAPQVAKTRLALGILAAVIATLAWGKFPTEWVAATGRISDNLLQDNLGPRRIPGSELESLGSLGWISGTGVHRCEQWHCGGHRRLGCGHYRVIFRGACPHRRRSLTPAGCVRDNSCCSEHCGTNHRVCKQQPRCITRAAACIACCQCMFVICQSLLQSKLYDGNGGGELRFSRLRAPRCSGRWINLDHGQPCMSFLVSILKNNEGKSIWES